MTKFQIGDRIRITQEVTVVGGPDDDGDWKISSPSENPDGVIGGAWDYFYKAEVDNPNVKVEVLARPFIDGDMIYVEHTNTMYIRTDGKWMYFHDGRWRTAVINENDVDSLWVDPSGETTGERIYTILRRAGQDVL